MPVVVAIFASTLISDLEWRFVQGITVSESRGHCPVIDLKQQGYLLQGPISKAPPMSRTPPEKFSSKAMIEPAKPTKRSGPEAHSTLLLRTIAARAPEGFEALRASWFQVQG